MISWNNIKMIGENLFISACLTTVLLGVIQTASYGTIVIFSGGIFTYMF